MSEKEKREIIESRLPTQGSIMEEYKKQGRELTEAEAEKIREQLRQEIAQGHVDARDDVLGDDVLETVAGGLGEGSVAPKPTDHPSILRNDDDDDDREGILVYDYRR
jgi:F0F1-type ATP synthase membrane subunit b/b'